LTLCEASLLKERLSNTTAVALEDKVRLPCFLSLSPDQIAKAERAQEEAMGNAKRSKGGESSGSGLGNLALAELKRAPGAPGLCFSRLRHELAPTLDWGFIVGLQARA